MLFYKKCPNPCCEEVNGFDLPKREIDEYDIFICNMCGEEFELNDWDDSTIYKFLKQKEKWKKRYWKRA